MISPLPRSSRLPLVALIVATALAAAGCGDASTGSTPFHPGGSSAGQGSTGGGSTDNGASSAGPGAPAGSGSAGSGSGTPAPTGTTGTTPGTPSTPAPTDPGGTPSTPTTPPSTPAAPAFDVMVDNVAPSIDLRAEQVIQVTVAPQSYTGDIALSVTGLPADITATFDKPTLSVSGTTGATAKLTLKSLSSTKPGAVPFNVVATAGATTKTTAASLTVKSVLVISIPVNVDANTGPDVFGTINVTAPPNLSATNGITVTFLNLDSTPHEIHGSQAAQGFPHDKGTFGQNQMNLPRTLNSAITYNFYLHDQGSAKTPGKIVVK